MIHNRKSDVIHTSYNSLLSLYTKSYMTWHRNGDAKLELEAESWGGMNLCFWSRGVEYGSLQFCYALVDRYNVT